MRISIALISLISLLAPLVSLAQPDLNGVFLRGSGSQGYPMSQWSAGELPFNKAGQLQFDNNVPGKGPRQTMPALGNDPLGDANPPGLYRTLVYGRPWEFIQFDNRVVQIFEWGKHWRTIWTDDREVPDVIIAGPYWYGYSVGEWENDTLVVKTVGLDGRAWVDEWGNQVSDFALIEEHWRRVGDTLEMTITVNDPDLYREPWTSDTKVFNLQSPDTLNGELMEQIFAPIDEMEFNRRIRDPAAAGPAGQN